MIKLFDIIKIRINSLKHKSRYIIKKILKPQPSYELEDTKIDKDKISYFGDLLNAFELIMNEFSVIDKIIKNIEIKIPDVVSFLKKYNEVIQKFTKYYLYTPMPELKNESRIVELFANDSHKVKGDLEIIDGKLMLKSERTKVKSEKVTINGPNTHLEIKDIGNNIQFDVEYRAVDVNGLPILNEFLGIEKNPYGKIEDVHVYAVELVFDVNKGVFYFKILPNESDFKIVGIRLNGEYIYRGITNKKEMFLVIPDNGELSIILMQEEPIIEYGSPTI